MIPRPLLGVALLCLAPAMAAAQPAPPAQGAAGLLPGDALRITVFEVPNLSGEFEVAPDSTLRHPVYNRLKVAGIPLASLQSHVDTFLRTLQRDPLVSVEPLVRISVVGEVRAPSAYLLPPQRTIADALTHAGGATPNGRLDRVVLERAGERWTLDLTRPDVASLGTTVRSGDRLLVESRRNLLRDRIGPIASVAGTVMNIVFLSRRRR